MPRMDKLRPEEVETYRLWAKRDQFAVLYALLLRSLPPGTYAAEPLYLERLSQVRRGLLKGAQRLGRGLQTTIYHSPEKPHGVVIFTIGPVQGGTDGTA